MSELLGITGDIGSGKTTLTILLGDMAENSATYESGALVIEVANRFNQLLEAELNFDTTDDDTELVNQILIWMPDIITEHLHHDTTWNHLAITAKDTRAHPELYDKLFSYLKSVRADLPMVETTITTENKQGYRDILQWLGGYFVAKISPTIWLDEIFRRIDLHDSRRDLVLIGGIRYPSDAAIVRHHGGRIIEVVRPGTHAKNTDVTERERSSIEPDITVVNNGTLEQLERVCEKLWNDIAAGDTQTEYHAA